MNDHFNELNGAPCTDANYDGLVATRREVEYGPEGNGLVSKLHIELSARVWLFQICTAFGFFKTTDTTEDFWGRILSLEYVIVVFQVVYRYHLNLCKDVFGEEFTPEFIQDGINETNSYFEGLSPKVALFLPVIFV